MKKKWGLEGTRSLIKRSLYALFCSHFYPLWGRKKESKFHQKYLEHYLMYEAQEIWIQFATFLSVRMCRKQLSAKSIHHFHFQQEDQSQKEWNQIFTSSQSQGARLPALANVVPTGLLFPSLCIWKLSLNAFQAVIKLILWLKLNNILCSNCIKWKSLDFITVWNFIAIHLD